MDRRGFLQHVTAPAVESRAGHSLLCEFGLDASKSTIYQDLRTRDGSRTVLPARGVARLLPQHLEPAYSPAAAPHLGPKMEIVGQA